MNTNTTTYRLASIKVGRHTIIGKADIYEDGDIEAVYYTAEEQGCHEIIHEMHAERLFDRLCYTDSRRDARDLGKLVTDTRLALLARCDKLKRDYDFN